MLPDLRREARYLVTGASGFIGSHLARRLASGGETVIGITASGRADRLRDMPPNFILAPLDLRDAASVAMLFAAWRFNVVFHLAAEGVRAQAGNARAMTEVNTLGSFELARIALHYGVERFVYCGSAFEYKPQDNPLDERSVLESTNLYGASKAAGWLLMDYLRRIEELPLTTVRPFTVFGPSESPSKLIPYVIGRALRGERIDLTGGTQVRDYLYVSDVVDALVLAADAAPGGVFNIGSGPAGARTVRSIVESLLDVMRMPLSLCRFGEAERSRIDPPYLVSDPSRAARDLGWKPRVSLIEGLKNTVAAGTPQ